MLAVCQIHHNQQSYGSLIFAVSLLCSCKLPWQTSIFAAKPEIIGVNRTSDPYDGKSFFLECEYIGIPTPSIVWSKDGIELSEQDDNIKIANLMDSYSRLQVSEASSTDDGMYECNISNPAGFTAHTFNVTVQSHMQGQFYYNY